MLWSLKISDANKGPSYMYNVMKCKVESKHFKSDGYALQLQHFQGYLMSIKELTLSFWDTNLEIGTCM